MKYIIFNFRDVVTSAARRPAAPATNGLLGRVEPTWLQRRESRRPRRQRDIVLHQTSSPAALTGTILLWSHKTNREKPAIVRDLILPENPTAESFVVGSQQKVIQHPGDMPGHTLALMTITLDTAGNATYQLTAVKGYQITKVPHDMWQVAKGLLLTDEQREQLTRFVGPVYGYDKREMEWGVTEDELRLERAREEKRLADQQAEAQKHDFALGTLDGPGNVLDEALSKLSLA